MSNNLTLQDAQDLLQRIDKLEHDMKNIQTAVSLLTELIKPCKGD